mgnify:CR=1 FL=1
MIGIDYHFFWGDMTPKLYLKYAEAYKNRIQNQFKLSDHLNHMLGKYIAFAYNDPKHYPEEPFLKKTKEPVQKNMSDEAMELMGKRIADKFNKVKSKE